jgi:hypothetical protein
MPRKKPPAPTFKPDLELFEQLRGIKLWGQSL